MNDIDSLKFNVILVDTEFKKEIDDCIKQAERLNTTLSEALRTVKAKKFVTDDGVKNSKEVAEAFERIKKAMENMPKGAGLFGDADALNKTLQQVNANLDKMLAKREENKKKTEDEAAAQKKVEDNAKKTNATLLNTSSILRTITQLTGVYFGAMGIRRFLSSMIDITGQFEVQRMALRNMLQDIDGADKIFHDLYKFSSDSTYRFSELAKYAKQLAAFNIDQNNLLETTKMLGDVASGVGVSMDRIILAYGHVKSSGFLRGIQLRSFSQNGVPVLEELSKLLTEALNKTVSLGDVFDLMMKRQIPFEMVEQAFKNMTSEGGKFYQMQEVLAKTLAGQINILKGRWENMLAAIGEANSGVLKGAVAKLNDLVLNYDKLGKLIGEVILVWGAYRGAVIATTIATEGLSTVMNLKMMTAFKNFAKWVMTNPWAILAAAITLCTIEIIKASRELDANARMIKALDDVTREYNESLDAEIGELDALFAALKNAHQGTDEYAAAKRALENRFGPYIQKLRDEGVEVNNLTALYDGLAKKIMDANKQRFLEDATKSISDEYGKAQKAIEDKTKALIRDMVNLTPDQEGAIRHYIRTGEKNAIFNSIENLGARRARRPYENSYQTKDDRKSFEDRIDDLKQAYEYSGEVFSQTMADAARRFDASVEETTNHAETELTGWRKKVQDVTSGLGDDILKETGLAQKQDEDYYDYLDRIGKKYKELREEEDKALKENKPLYKGYIDAIKAVDKALEGNILKDARYNKEPWNGRSGGSGSSSDPFAKEITNARARIAIWEKYKNAYEKLESVFGDNANAQFAKLFPGVDPDEIDKQLEILLVHLEGLGENGKTAAESLRASLGLDEVSKAIKEYNAAQKALDAYEKALAKFDKDWGTGDKAGAAKKVSDAVRKRNNEDKKIDDEYLDAQMKAFEAHSDNVDIIKEETDRLEELYEARKAANDEDFAETLRGIADDIFNEQMAGFDLSDWSHKSLSDILAIKRAIENLHIPPEIEAMLDKDSLAVLQDALTKLKDKTLQNTVNPEVIKKWSKYAKQVAGYITKAANAMKKLADATGSTALSDASAALSAIGQNLNAAAEGFEKSGSWIGAVVGGVVDIFNQVTTAMAESREEMERMEDTIRNIRLEAENTAFKNLLSDGADGIFGENFVRRIRNAADGISEVNEKLKKMNSYLMEYKKHLFLDKRMDVIKNGATGGEIPILTKHSFWGGDTFKTIDEIAKEFGMDTLDRNDNLNPTLLQKILDTYGELNKEAKDWLSSAIEYSNEYELAMQQIESATKDVFDNLASDMADKFIDNFLAMGDAVNDLSDTFADLGDAILRSFLQSYIIDEILGKYKEDAQNALKRYSVGEMTPEDYAAWLDGFASTVEEESRTLAPAINSMIEAFKDRGLMNLESSSSSSLGNGIKSITEDTANLLASYINAIRADVSYIRLMQERGWENVGALAGGLPTLNDYLAQISASTFDTARDTNRILDELRSVIGAPGTSGMVVRVESY